MHKLLKYIRPSLTTLVRPQVGIVLEQALKDKEFVWEVDRFTCTDQVALKIVEASGLRSKKFRLRKKRLKVILHYMLVRGLDVESRN